MYKTLIAITVASTFLSGCVSVQNYDDAITSTNYSYSPSETHSQAMNTMMMAYNIEPKNPNNLDEFTGDYHKRLANRSNLTGGAFTAMSLLGGAGLGSSLFSGVIHSPTDKMYFEVRNHSLIRVHTLNSIEELPDIVKNNREEVVSSVKDALKALDYDVTHYRYGFELYLRKAKARYVDEVDLFVRNDLEHCQTYHAQINDGSLTANVVFNNVRERDKFLSCTIKLSESSSRLVVDGQTGQLNYVWSVLRPHNVNDSWHVETYNAMSLDDKTYLYSPSFLWLNARNHWAEVDVETMDRAIEHGVITPTPRLKVLDGSNKIIPFSLDEA
ncbi:hypothetical protein [Photobacterium satsumensis]|uniref:hypothetical protein n=1 Tax=Photobacterium satsumensis TaxID=2910239 RepID=UPI003D1285C0